jgi:hypothetical protein
MDSTVYNAILDLEQIQRSLKLGIVTPVYKGQGRDPLNTNNYRGITVSSVFSKLLELMIQSRLQLTLEEHQIPHRNQTGRLVVQMLSFVLYRYFRKGDMAYMCSFDLQKAFDTVQHPVLLKDLTKQDYAVRRGDY